MHLNKTDLISYTSLFNPLAAIFYLVAISLRNYWTMVQQLFRPLFLHVPASSGGNIWTQPSMNTLTKYTLPGQWALLNKQVEVERKRTQTGVNGFTHSASLTPWFIDPAIGRPPYHTGEWRLALLCRCMLWRLLSRLLWFLLWRCLPTSCCK